ncbi:hypothetical protein HHX48_08525 [Salinimonas sp. HHU 13199]|uniref:Uncharacterized protein n=1 Tax=Salinimonas profundi TaxID=2729140 RepID=A0ABR8LLF1_9ALTE|nr:hypothetical protein [Salinimonas profundi]MBD3585776.1 hypothetical protein [Salinimonas profundi]
MRSSFLSNKYKQWLQANPEDARLQRMQMQETANRFLEEGDEASAIHCSAQALEIAQAIIQSLRCPEEGTTLISQDFIAYGALAIYLANHYRAAGEKDAAQEIIHDAQQQLMALTPLYASEPQVAQLIQAIVQSLSDDRPAPKTGPDGHMLH